MDPTNSDDFPSSGAPENATNDARPDALANHTPTNDGTDPGYSAYSGATDTAETTSRSAETTPPRRHHLVSTVAAIVALALATGSGGFMLGHLTTNARRHARANPGFAFPQLPSGSEDFPPVATPSSQPPANSPAAKVAAAVDRGLVDISTNLSYQGASAAGTGMVISANGLVLTNNHVIDGATSITARDVANNTTYQVSVLGYDVTGDVALLQLQGASGLATVTTGNSSSVTASESVAGIGNAGGVGGIPSYAAGNVVAVDQSVSASDQGSATGAELLKGMIEVNADIQPGDSGGPLVNAKGRVIGIDTAGSTSGFPGFSPSGTRSVQGYAIPINTALKIVTSIARGRGSAKIHIGKTAFLGIAATPTLTGAAQSSTGGPPGTASGVSVAATIPGTPAARTPLAVGDVITSIDAHAVASITGLQQILLTLHPGTSITVGYVTPNGASHTVHLTLASGPPQ